MNKKQVALGILITTFCAASMTACGEYGAPERYHDYQEEKSVVDNTNVDNDSEESNVLHGVDKDIEKYLT